MPESPNEIVAQARSLAGQVVADLFPIRYARQVVIGGDKQYGVHSLVRFETDRGPAQLGSIALSISRLLSGAAHYNEHFPR